MSATSNLFDSDVVVSPVPVTVDPPRKLNMGEWGEPYAALRILGDKKLFIADRNGNRNPTQWLDVLALIRQETKDRVVRYQYDPANTDVVISTVNEKGKERHAKFPVNVFLQLADDLLAELKRVKAAKKKGKDKTKQTDLLEVESESEEKSETSKTAAFAINPKLDGLLAALEFIKLKAKSVNKSDVHLDVTDPRSGVTRNNIGFSIKSELGQKPTLFNTSSASGAIFEITGMDDALMHEINNIFFVKNNGKKTVPVKRRWLAMLDRGCAMNWIGYPIAKKAKVKAFEENLDLIDPRLPRVLAEAMRVYFSNESMASLSDIVQWLVTENPLGITRPEVKYPYMIKSFIYATYCGMTAANLWDGRSEVNGGFIRVSETGEVLAFYAMESDSFKEYLFKHCVFETPSTDSSHGDYGDVVKVEGRYEYKLNFQIRYTV